MKKLITVSLASAAVLAMAGCAPIIESAAAPEATLVETTSEDTQLETTTDESVESTNIDTSESTDATSTEQSSVEAEGALSSTDETVELLNYLIEEEKLAHDVYTVMYDLYGSKVFGNILESESTHQDQVLGLLDAYGVEDPRSSELGVFNDPELQALYDQLIEMGSQSAQDAYQVGVLIEEKDIADITTQLATASDPDVVSVLEKLRSGSENHLRAFNRQL
jgi:hypothetical protein